MKLSQPVNKGRTEKTVHIDLEGEMPLKSDVFSFALTVAGETTMSIFGYNMKVVENSDGAAIAVVSLYTD